MSEPKAENTATVMSRAGFLKNLALLAGAFGLAGLELPALFRRGGGLPGPDPGPRPAAPSAITPPTRSVKRRG
ncbi:MAG: hypothetical protein ABSH53_20285 [Holophaga sp.]